MIQNNLNNKKKTLKDFDDSMKLLLTESIKFFPVSSINRIRRKYKALNILRKDGSLTYFMNELIRIKKIGILAGCSAGAMIMGEKMIKGTGLNFIKNSIIIPHYGESYYSWISNTVKLLNKGKYKLICLEKNTYFTITESNIKIIGDNNIHIIYKNNHTTYSDGDILDLSILEL